MFGAVQLPNLTFRGAGACRSRHRNNLPHLWFERNPEDLTEVLETGAGSIACRASHCRFVVVRSRTGNTLIGLDLPLASWMKCETV